MLLRIHWIEQIAFLHTSQATISALKNDVNLLRAMLHCVRAFTFEKTISTSTTKYKCRCELGKTKKVLDNTIKRTLAHKNSFNFARPISNILRCFDWVFRRPYRYFSFVLKSDFIPVWSLWSFHHWMILDWIAVINCLIKKVQNDSN